MYYFREETAQHNWRPVTASPTGRKRTAQPWKWQTFESPNSSPASQGRDATPPPPCKWSTCRQNVLELSGTFTTPTGAITAARPTPELTSSFSKKSDRCGNTSWRLRRRCRARRRRLQSPRSHQPRVATRQFSSTVQPASVEPASRFCATFCCTASTTTSTSTFQRFWVICGSRECSWCRLWPSTSSCIQCWYNIWNNPDSFKKNLICIYSVSIQNLLFGQIRHWNPTVCFSKIVFWNILVFQTKPDRSMCSLQSSFLVYISLSKLRQQDWL